MEEERGRGEREEDGKEKRREGEIGSRGGRLTEGGDRHR
jgi:hypothetical protein